MPEMLNDNLDSSLCHSLCVQYNTTRPHATKLLCSHAIVNLTVKSFITHLDVASSILVSIVNHYYRDPPCLTGSFLQKVQYKQRCVELWHGDVWDMVTWSKTFSQLFTREGKICLQLYVLLLFIVVRIPLSSPEWLDRSETILLCSY